MTGRQRRVLVPRNSASSSCFVLVGGGLQRRSANPTTGTVPCSLGRTLQTHCLLAAAAIAITIAIAVELQPSVAAAPRCCCRSPSS